MMSTMRSLGRSQGLFLSNSIYANYTTTRTISSTRIKVASPESSVQMFSTCLHILNANNIMRKLYLNEEDLILNQRSITKGDTICLKDLLFTNNMDYLIQNNNQQVKVEQLEGKVIGIYFMPLYGDGFLQLSKWATSLLKDVYEDLHPDNNFDVVLVSYYDLDIDRGIEIPI